MQHNIAKWEQKMQDCIFYIAYPAFFDDKYEEKKMKFKKIFYFFSFRTGKS